MARSDKHQLPPNVVALVSAWATTEFGEDCYDQARQIITRAAAQAAEYHTAYYHLTSVDINTLRVLLQSESTAKALEDCHLMMLNRKAFKRVEERI